MRHHVQPIDKQLRQVCCIMSQRHGLPFHTAAQITPKIRSQRRQARQTGGPDHRALIWRYLTLNCISTISVFLTLRFGQVILVGSALGFLGMGAQPPEAELGMMAAQGRDFLFMAPHIATIPSLAILVIVLAANLLGDAVRDVLDPRLQQ